MAKIPSSVDGHEVEPESLTRGNAAEGPNKNRFEVLFSEGKRISGAFVRVSSLPGTGLIGIGTSKQLGSKPQRNRVKRRFRECVVAHRELIDPTLDYIFIVNSKATNATLPQLLGEAAELIEKSKTRWASESECSL
jgi:ribonuclease P protein component